MLKKIRNIQVEVQIFSAHTPTGHPVHLWATYCSLWKPLNYTWWFFSAACKLLMRQRICFLFAAVSMSWEQDLAHKTLGKCCWIKEWFLNLYSEHRLISSYPPDSSTCISLDISNLIHAKLSSSSSYPQKLFPPKVIIVFLCLLHTCPPGA